MKKTAYILTGLFLLVEFASGQTPTGLSFGSEPVEFNAVKILLYIVLPVAILVAYFLLRRRKVKRGKEEPKEREKE